MMSARHKCKIIFKLWYFKDNNRNIKCIKTKITKSQIQKKKQFPNHKVLYEHSPCMLEQDE